MRWYSREFLRSLRRRAWREAQTKPGWRKTAWRIRIFEVILPQFGLVIGSAVRPAFPWLFIFITIGVEVFSEKWAKTHTPVLWLCLISWAVTLALVHTNYLLQLACGWLGVSALAQYPVNSLQVWDRIFGNLFRISMWLIYDAVVVFWFACREVHAPPLVWFEMVIVAAAFWASVLALIVVLYARRWPALVYVISALLLFAGGPIASIVLLRTGHLTPALVAKVHGILVWGTPPGWACQLAEWLTGVRADFPFAAVGLLVALVVYAIPCYRQIRERYTFWPLDDSGSMAPREKPVADLDPEIISANRVDEIEQRVKSGAFLLPRIRQHSDSLSRRIIPTSPREEAIVDFLVGGRAYWAKPYAFGAVLVLLAPLLWKALRTVDSDAASVLLALTSLMGLLIATAYSSEQWRGSVVGMRQSCSISPFALLPIGLPEMGNAILRVSVLRLIVALPCWLLAGAWMSFPMAESLLSGLCLGGLAWLAILLLQPAFAVFRYSRRIQPRFLTGMGLLFLAIWPVAAMGGFVYAVVARAAWEWQVAALAALGLTSWGAGAIYRRYIAPRFDMLMVMLPSQRQPSGTQAVTSTVSVGGWR